MDVDQNSSKHVSGNGPTIRGDNYYNGGQDGKESQASGDANVSGQYAPCGMYGGRIKYYSADEYNALKCEVIGVQREKDALVLKLHTLSAELSDAREQVTCLQRKAEQEKEYYETRLDAERAERDKERETHRKQNEDKFEKIRSYALTLLQSSKLRYQTQNKVLQSKMEIQAQEEEKARQTVEADWQKRMDVYKNDLATQFNELLKDVQRMQGEKRQMEETFTSEFQQLRSLNDNLHLEARMWKDKHQALETTMEKLKENNALLREKIASQNEAITQMTKTVKEGVEERQKLEKTMKEMMEKKKTMVLKKTEESKASLARAKSDADRMAEVPRKDVDDNERSYSTNTHSHHRGKSMIDISSGKMMSDLTSVWHFDKKNKPPPRVWK